MKKITFKFGDQVQDTFLGRGQFIKYFGPKSYAPFALVLWDKRPPIRYNMGENPSVCLAAKLKPFAPKETQPPKE